MNYEEKFMEIKKTMMSPAERSKKYFSNEVVDCQPYALHGPENAIAEFLGYTTSEVAKDYDKFVEVCNYRENKLGITGTNIRLALQTMGMALGSGYTKPEHGITAINDHILKDYSDFNKLKVPNPRENPILKGMLDRAVRFHKDFPDMPISSGVVGPFSMAVSIRPLEKILKDTRKNPEALHELLEFCVDCSLEWLRVFTEEVNPHTASISAPVTCSDILNIKQFEEFSFPVMKRLTQGMTDITGFKPTLHICGHTKPLWKYLKELSISSFSVDNCEDLEELKEELGNDIVIIGNVPPVDILRLGTPEQVVESVKECLKKGAESPKGYIVSSGCQVPLGTPKENIYAYLYSVAHYGKNAKLGQLPEGLSQ